MIDIHAHILPFLDDGAEDWDCTLEMARLAADSGVMAVVATPHCGLPGQELEGRAEAVREQTDLLSAKLQQAGIRLAVGTGMEIFGTPDTAELLCRGKLITLNRSRYPLIEFPFLDYAPQATRILASVLDAGFRPVIAHPERYQYTQADPTLLNLWSDMGCLLQLNRGSLQGRFGRAAEVLSWAMVNRGFAFVVASDAHSPSTRTTRMKEIRALLETERSAHEAARLLLDNPRLLVSDADIDFPDPIWF